MRRLTKLTLASLTAGLLVAGVTTHALGTTTPQDDPPTARAAAEDDLPSPLSDKQRAMKKEAVARALKGAKTQERNGSEVMKLGKNDYVEMATTQEDPVFTILSRFGDKIDPRTAGTPGPADNQIAKPDRDWNGNATDDNSTYWVSDFNQAHYQKLLFGDKESFRDFYKKQSGGKFTVNGEVSDWVQLPYNEARYGSNDIPESDGAWNFIGDTATAWYEAQKAAGKSDAEIKQYLSKFDVRDRYDYDGDGNFNEPDGYVDHFQAIHAGEGEEAGGGAQGADAIWSHRWYAFSDGIGNSGPDNNKQGGAQLGNTGIWIGDYTAQPENGGLGVFCHEFGHDLGLPDLYDTSGGDNGTGFWSIMSGGSWLNKGFDSIGTKPGYMGAWEKLVLGWLDYEVVPFQGAATNVTLGRAGKPGDNPGAVVVTLPKQKITKDYNKPNSGEYEWWSGSADNLNVTLARELDLTGATSSASLNAKAWYDIEQDFDYLYAEVSTDGGSSWEKVGDPVSGSSDGKWTDLKVDLSAYKGKKVQLRYRYQSDGGVHLAGAFLDDLSLVVDGTPAWTDDVEAGEGDWTADGFTRMTGSVTEDKEHYYIAENRQYVDYDDTLRTGPYNFGWANTKPDWVERFPYQNGLLIWYVNYAYEDNNTKSHPGYGNVLPIDARPTPVKFPGGALLGNRRQPFDATFGREKTDPVTFHRNGVAADVPSSPAIPLFDDSNPEAYWAAENPQNSCKVAGEGVKIKVVSGTTSALTVKIWFA